MKNLKGIGVTIILSLLLTACKTDSSQNEDTSTDTVQTEESNDTSSKKEDETKTSTDSTKTSVISEETDITEESGQNIFYYETYELSGDSGDGISPDEGADLVVKDVLSSMEIYDSLSENQCIYISFDDLLMLDSAMGDECYIYSIAYGTKEDGFQGENYEVMYRAAVDYSTSTAFMYEDYSNDDYVLSDSDDVSNNSYDSEKQSDPGDTQTLEWWGKYMGDGFSIEINNFDGTSFDFAVSNLRNGEYILEGVAEIDSEDSYMAVCEDFGFYLYEDYSAIDFLSSESAEWENLRGQYTRLEE